MSSPGNNTADKINPFQTTLSRIVTICNQRGLHARPCGKVVKMLDNFDCDVRMLSKEMDVSARSIMDLLMLAAGPGTTIEIVTSGPDAREALDALSSLIENGFGEKD